MAATETRFVRRVRAEMGAQALSIRGLARRMDPQNVDRARRNLHRWLDEGISPNRSSVAEIATALGVEGSELASDDEDDEEADPMVDLVTALRRFVREELAVKT